MRTGGGKCGNAPHTFKPAIGPYKTEAGLESEIGTPGRALRGGHSCILPLNSVADVRSPEDVEEEGHQVDRPVQLKPEVDAKQLALAQQPPARRQM